MNYRQHLLYTNLACQVLQYNDFHIQFDLSNYKDWRAYQLISIITILKFLLFISNEPLFMIQILTLFFNLKKQFFHPDGHLVIQFHLQHFQAPRNFLGLTYSSLHPLLLHLQLAGILLLHLHIRLQNLRLYHFVRFGCLFYHNHLTLIFQKAFVLLRLVY